MIYDHKQKKKSSVSHTLSYSQDEGDDFSPVKEQKKDRKDSQVLRKPVEKQTS